MKRIVLGALAALALTGCSLLKVNVNGREMSLADVGGNTDAQGAASSGASSAQEKVVPVNDSRVVENVVLDANVTDVPKIVKAEGVGVQALLRKQLGVEPNCGSYTSKKPVATFDLKQDMPKSFVVSLTGRYADGVAIVRSGLVWNVCTYASGEVPTMAAPQQGWVAGHYEVWPVSLRNPNDGATFDVEFWNPENPAKWSSAVRKISIAKKLDKPMFVEVTTKTNRVVMREQHAGRGCEKTPLPLEPDLAITLERPIPGLVVRPLYTKTPVVMQVTTPKTSRHQAGKRCTSYRSEFITSQYTPSYESPVELHFSREDEGTYGIALGTANPGEAQKVTLMIFDASTKFDPLALVPPQGELPLEERVLANFYPQLDTRELSFEQHANAELTAKLFATAPKELFVYSKLDLDKDIARQLTRYVSEDEFPKKNEPMLLLGFDGDSVHVVTADGVRYALKNTHVLPKPDGAVAWAAAPRKLRKDIKFGDLINMAPASAKSIVSAYDARMKKYDACADKVWAPYGKQLDGARWTVRSSDGSATTVESPRAQKIREQGETAIAKACGSTESLDKDKQATAARLLVEVEKERARLLKQATSKL